MHPEIRGPQGFRRHKPGGAKTLGPSARPTPFPYNFHIGAVNSIYMQANSSSKSVTQNGGI